MGSTECTGPIPSAGAAACTSAATANSASSTGFYETGTTECTGPVPAAAAAACLADAAANNASSTGFYAADGSTECTGPIPDAAADATADASAPAACDDGNCEGDDMVCGKATAEANTEFEGYDEATFDKTLLDAVSVEGCVLLADCEKAMADNEKAEAS